MPRLALYFVDNDETPRYLNSEAPSGHDDEGCPFWRIGRRKHASGGHGAADICFDNQAVSREQAYIRLLEKHQRQVWQVKHVGRNRTFKQDGEIPLELPYGKWVDLDDQDRIFFVYRDLGFVVATSEDTFIEDCEEDDEPTIGRPRVKESEPEGPPASETGKTVGDALSEVIPVLLNGPKGFPNWLWWLLLLGATILIVWLIYG